MICLGGSSVTPVFSPSSAPRCLGLMHVFRPSPEVPSSTVSQAADLSPTLAHPRWLRCAVCGHRVTSPTLRIEVQGDHRHTFANPAGIAFHIGCFRAAPGCAPVGPSSSEYTWFPGYRWQIAVCQHCQTHLGWHYEGDDGVSSFYGLILCRLLEAP
jgi:hypothetical protein